MVSLQFLRNNRRLLQGGDYFFMLFMQTSNITIKIMIKVSCPIASPPNFIRGYVPSENQEG